MRIASVRLRSRRLPHRKWEPRVQARYAVSSRVHVKERICHDIRGMRCGM